ncbi:60S ribosomal protein L23A (nucleomorph) [Cryptomonas paramecium]|uniref:60S ribosomal protein L23A n=1 Tax=Cryptomonas paramaecium TaxID=2898 RepID=F2HH85_9CRYP|nr:60S ribosomal protein L23A [Cryptomonas paramecium]AEA38681.1 60S ribosomal protein L23A [Cryptomonas paramecium]|mmetsp:Transcript_52166/g.136373  ORF Transcript_52166/g.136373 Transcript_52166/m.136373 type:complete len:125 (+) Transcript_52166:5136-5510(+)
MTNYKEKTSNFFFKLPFSKTFDSEKNMKRLRKLNRYKKKSCSDIIKYPLVTEASMKKIQYENTITIITHPSTTKKKIFKFIKVSYKTLPVKINTLIQLNGNKKAFIKFPSHYDALDVANKIGFI